MRLWEVVADGALCGHTAIFATPLRLVSFTPINLVFYFWFKPRCKRGTQVKGHSNLQVACTNNGSWPRKNMMTVTGKIFKLGTSLKKKLRIQSLRSTPCQLGKIYVVLYTSHLNHYGRFRRQTCTQIMCFLPVNIPNYRMACRAGKINSAD